MSEKFVDDFERSVTDHNGNHDDSVSFTKTVKKMVETMVKERRRFFQRENDK